MTSPLRLIGFLAGLAVVIGTLLSVFGTLVMPRQTSSRLLRGISRVLGWLARRLVVRLPSYEAKDRAVAVVGPLAMVSLFVLWLTLLLTGFGFMLWWRGSGSLGHAFVVAGSSVFTLGIVSRPDGEGRVLEILASGMGFLVVALEIAYLPTLYSAFSVRENQVTLLATRAGTPAWGVEVLARHHWFNTMPELPGLYSDWEEWAAAVSESHTAYPTLMWFRSPVGTRSWLVALAAMLDAAALHDSCLPSTAPRQARILLAMGVDCVRTLAAASHIGFDADPLPTAGIRLTREEFDVGLRRLDQVGFGRERSDDEVWRQFQGWRVNYEPIIDALTADLMPPPAPWLLPQPHIGEVRRAVIRNRTPDDPEAERQFTTDRGA